MNQVLRGITVSVMPIGLKLLVAFMGLLLVAQNVNAAGERRVALVIGNGAYQDARLPNPANDAEDIASALRSLGFEVIARRDVDQKKMKTAIREFGQKLRGAETGLFYFAGHGMQVKGVNYIIPVGMDIQNEADTEDQGVNLDYVFRTLEEGGARFNITILDACRNNPFAHSFRSASRGLAIAQASGGMLIAYATSPGSVAADGTERNGIYTKHLLKNLKDGDSDIQKVFQRVRTGVVAETRGKQTPWETTSLTGDFYFKPGTQVASLEPVKIAAPIAEPVREDGDTALWNEVQKGGTSEDYRAYLAKYPNGKYDVLAKGRLKKLDDEALQRAKQREIAELQTAKPQTSSAIPVCVFPNSNVAAPGWVCDIPVEGYEITTVGSASMARKNPAKNTLPLLQAALLDAAVLLAQRMKVQVQNMVKQYSEVTGTGKDETVSKVNTSVTKQLTSLKIGKKISLDNLVKQYVEVSGAGKDETVDMVSSSTSKLVMETPCAYTMKSHVETTGAGINETVDEVSGEEAKNCTINDLTKELSNAGLKVVDTVKSPMGDLFLLLGAKKLSELKVVY